MTMTTRTCRAGLLLATALLPGCIVRQQYAQPKLSEDLQHLMHDLDTLPPFPQPDTASGSLWTAAGVGAALVRDLRAFRLNDLVVIDLQERSLGTNQSNTALDRSSDAGFGADVAFGLEDPNPQPGKFNVNQALSASSQSSFAGDGTTARSSLLTGNIAARVLRVLPNGDLIIAGQKNVMVNRERQVLTLVGSIRPSDVARNNHVSSSQVGDLTVRMWGRGEIDDTVRQGWFMRIMNRIWPF